MKESQQRPTQAQRPVRYYIVKTEHDDQPVVRSVPVSRPPAPPAVTATAPVEVAAAAPTEGGSERESAAGGRRGRIGVGRLVRAAEAIRRHPSGR